MGEKEGGVHVEVVWHSGYFDAKIPSQETNGDTQPDEGIPGILRIHNTRGDTIG